MIFYLLSVLNTDNMSILGLTIDYGPFGFLDHYDPNHVCNASGKSRQYCSWLNNVQLTLSWSDLSLPLSCKPATISNKGSSHEAIMFLLIFCQRMFFARLWAPFYFNLFIDDQGRYSYQAQPEICKWNLIKLAEAIKDVLPLERSKAAVDEM